MWLLLDPAWQIECHFSVPILYRLWETFSTVSSPRTTLLWVPVTPLSLLSPCSFPLSFLTPPRSTLKCCHPSLESSVLGRFFFRLFTFNPDKLITPVAPNTIHPPRVSRCIAPAKPSLWTAENSYRRPPPDVARAVPTWQVLPLSPKESAWAGLRKNRSYRKLLTWILYSSMSVLSTQSSSHFPSHTKIQRPWIVWSSCLPESISSSFSLF